MDYQKCNCPLKGDPNKIHSPACAAYAKSASTGAAASKGAYSQSRKLKDLFGGKSTTDTTSEPAQTFTSQVALDDLIARIVMGEPPETMKITPAQMAGIFSRLGITAMPNGMSLPTANELSRQDWDAMREALALMIEKSENGAANNTPQSSTPSPTTTAEELEIERKILGDMAESAGAQNRIPAVKSEGARRSPAPGATYHVGHDEWWHPDGRRWRYDGTPISENARREKVSSGRKYLFVGGAANGRWMAVPAGEQRRTAIPEPAFLPRYESPGDRPMEIKQSNYIRVPLRIGGGEAAYFACTDLGTDMDEISQVAFEMLLRGYRPNAYDDCGECSTRRQFDAIHKRD